MSKKKPIAIHHQQVSSGKSELLSDSEVSAAKTELLSDAELSQICGGALMGGKNIL